MKVLIVDDDRFVRQGLKKLIPWKDMQCLVVGEAADGASGWKLVLEQFDDYLIKILLFSAAFSFTLAIFQNNGEGITAFVEPFVIILILVINAIIGVWQENNAANALKALKEMQSENARCLRDGKLNHDLPASHLVPGDIIQIQVGDKVPADCRLLKLKTTTLRVEESALTGESKTIMKVWA